MVAKNAYLVGDVARIISDKEGIKVTSEHVRRALAKVGHKTERIGPWRCLRESDIEMVRKGLRLLGRIK